jgi:hypothetical protein
MAARKFRIPTDAADALRTDTTYDGPRVTITRQLGADVWRGVKTVLEKLGAEFVVGGSAFEFEPDQDARTLVMAALADGHVMAASASHGFVATPDDLAADLVDAHGEIRPVRGRKLRVLEPSAGRGAFVRAILGDDGERIITDAAPEWLHVTAVEVDARRARYIPDGPAVMTCVETFEEFHARATVAGWEFDRIIMNPPFSTPGRPQMWAEHLTLAWELLAPGGRLLAIVPAAVLDARRDKRHTAVRALVERNGGTVELDRTTFAASGVLVATAVVWLDRPTVDPDGAADALGCTFYGREFAYDLYPYTGAEPVIDVDRPVFTRGAAITMPVQAWRDNWRGTVRTVRYVANCCECGRPTWAFDDGENDPRGVLGDAAALTLEAAEYDQVGPPMGFCFVCANTDAETYNRAVERASRRWTTPPVAAPAPEVDPADVVDPDADVSPWALVGAV